MICRKGIPQHHYTDEERLFLKDNSPKFTRRELTDQFNRIVEKWIFNGKSN